MKKQNHYKDLTLGEASEKLERELYKQKIEVLEIELKYKEAQLEKVSIGLELAASVVDMVLKSKKIEPINWWFPFTNKQ